MESKKFFDEFPATITDARLGSHVYKKSNQLFAVFGDQQLDRWEIELVVDNPRFTIYRGQPDHDLEARIPDELSPVYQVDGAGPPVVPTGKVFARFSERLRIEDFCKELEEAGYRLSSKLSYAPNAGWLTSNSDCRLDAIKSLKNLLKNPRLAHCELQMVSARQKKIANGQTRFEHDDTDD